MIKNNENFCDFALIGSGNIAYKHGNNIKKLFPKKSIILCKRTRSLVDKGFKKICSNITSDIKSIKPLSKQSTAIIASPASMHINDSIILINNGFNLLIEKPLSTDEKNIKKLIIESQNRKSQIMVAYNLRFLKSINKLKDIIKSNLYGNIVSAHIHVASDARKWRSNKQFKNTVSANKKLGGGAINELSHEIDYMYYIFGKPDDVVTLVNNTDKNIDVEDSATSIFSFKNNKYYISLYQNMLSNNEMRYIDVHCKKGNLHLDLLKNTLEIKKNLSSKKKYKFKTGIVESYKTELISLSRLIKTNKDNISPISSALKIIKIIAGMRKSSIKKKVVTL